MGLNLWDEMRGLSDDQLWTIIGMANRLKNLGHKMHDAVVDGKLIKVYADDELLGVLALDYEREQREV